MFSRINEILGLKIKMLGKVGLGINQILVGLMNLFFLVPLVRKFSLLKSCTQLVKRFIVIHNRCDRPSNNITGKSYCRLCAHCICVTFS